MPGSEAVGEQVATEIVCSEGRGFSGFATTWMAQAKTKKTAARIMRAAAKWCQYGATKD